MEDNQCIVMLNLQCDNIDVDGGLRDLRRNKEKEENLKEKIARAEDE